jgi:myosin heavy chain 9/10/11/14
MLTTPQLETQLEEQESKQSAEQRSMRNIDRTVRDFQSQIERRDKINAQLTDDINKSRDKIERLLQTIEELQSSDTQNQIQARRAERELREEREKALRLERELEGWKALRIERGSTVGRPSMAALSDVGSRRGSGVYVGSVSNGPIEVPQRKASTTKGFL